MNFKKILLPTAAAASLLFTNEINAQTTQAPQEQKLEMALKEQEKGLTVEQRQAWEFFQQTPDYKNMFPGLLKSLRLNKISQNPNCIYIPGENFTIMVFKRNKAVRLATPHANVENFLPQFEKSKRYDSVASRYVVRPHGKSNTQMDDDIDLIYQNINEKIHHLVTFTKPDTKNNPYQYRLNGTFINTPALYKKPLSSEQLAQLGLNESEAETQLNNILGRTLSKEEILRLNGTKAYCQYWFSPLSHYSVGKRAHDFFSIGHIYPLDKAQQGEVQQEIDKTYAFILEREFTSLPQNVKKLPLYKTAPAQLEALVLQLEEIYVTLKQAQIFKANESISIAHTNALVNLIKQKMTRPVTHAPNVQDDKPAGAKITGNEIVYTLITPDIQTVPTHHVSQEGIKAIEKYMYRPLANVPKPTSVSLANAQDCLSAIMKRLYTFPMPNLNKEDFKAGKYGGKVVELPVLLQNKKQRISLHEMRLAQRVDNPIIWPMNDIAGRPWTFKEVINNNPKKASIQRLSKVLSKYRLDDYGYSFLVISKLGPLSDDEVAETSYLIKTQIRAAMENSFKDIQKQAQHINIYAHPLGKELIDAAAQKIGDLEQTIRQSSYLFDYNDGLLPASLAHEEILNNMNNINQTNTPISRQRVPSQTQLKEQRVRK